MSFLVVYPNKYVPDYENKSILTSSEIFNGNITPTRIYRKRILEECILENNFFDFLSRREFDIFVNHLSISGEYVPLYKLDYKNICGNEISNFLKNLAKKTNIKYLEFKTLDVEKSNSFLLVVETHNFISKTLDNYIDYFYFNTDEFVCEDNIEKIYSRYLPNKIKDINDIVYKITYKFKKVFTKRIYEKF